MCKFAEFNNIYNKCDECVENITNIQQMLRKFDKCDGDSNKIIFINIIIINVGKYCECWRMSDECDK